MEHTDHHVGRLIDSLARPRRPRGHPRLLRDRRQRRLRRGHRQRHLQRVPSPSTAPTRWRRPRCWRRRSTSSGPPRPTTTTRSAGRTRWTPPTNGPSRSAPTGAGPATARSSTGPAGIEAKGEIRDQFSHVIDIAADRPRRRRAAAPDLRPRRPADAAARQEHAAELRRRRGSRAPRDAVLRDVRQPRHLPQGLDRGDPAQHRPGWSTPSCRRSTTTSGSSTHRTTGPRPTTSSAENPEKLHELQRLFLIEAVRYGVLPLDDRRVERFEPHIAGRPMLVKGNSQILYGGMKRITENSMIVIKNRSHSVTAQLVIPEGGAEGVIIAQGGAFGGWSLYLKEGRPTYCYNLLGVARFKVARRRAAGRRRAPAADGVRLRRRRPRQRRRRHPLRRRRQGRRRPGRGERCR